MSSSNPIIAWDARLVGGTSTGDSTYWTGLLHGFSQMERPPRLLLISNNDRPSSVPWREEWEWRVLPAKGPLGSRLWSYLMFPRLAKKLGAGVVHVQYSMSPLIKNGITTIHDVSFFVGPEWFGAKDRLILQRSVPAAARRAKRIIAVSETSRGEIERFIPAAKGKVRATLLAPAPWIEPVEKAHARSYVAERFGEQGPFFFTVGTRWARKNQELAVAAVEALPDNLPHRLLVAGKNPSPFSGSRTRSLGYVTNENLNYLYSAAEGFIFPSRHEGFGIPALEAMRCRTPVICGPGGALPEVVADAGIVLPDFETQTWTQALVKLTEGSSNLLTDRGAERASQFSWLSTAAATMDAYQEVLNS